MPRPFRFGAQIAHPPAATASSWAATARAVEDLGYATLCVPDHFDDQLAPIPALVAAAGATTTLRLGTLVLGNDYRHPVVVAKEAATLDVLSDGRLELGLGAGWQHSDYQRSGIPLDPPGRRIERFAEAVSVVKGLLAGEPFSFCGNHYRVQDLAGTPRPVQRPRPPIVIGGGGRRLLAVAGREADVVNVNFDLRAGVVGPELAATGTAAATTAKLAWLRETAGPRFGDLELGVTVFVAAVTADRASLAADLATAFGLTPEEVLASPHVLAGTVDQMVDDLRRRREELGFSYVVFSGTSYQAMAPVVERLAGT
jgi:probable F420-dependent oxidoreductase